MKKIITRADKSTNSVGPLGYTTLYVNLAEIMRVNAYDGTNSGIWYVNITYKNGEKEWIWCYSKSEYDSVMNVLGLN